MTIWKVPIEFTEEQEIKLPRGAELLSAQMQYDIPCLWALVDPNRDMETKTILLYGTGYKMPKKIGQYLGTVQTASGALVFHIFVRA